MQDSHVFYRLQNVSSNSRNYDYLLMCLSTKKVKVVISDNDHSFLYFTFVLLDDLYQQFMEMTISDHLHHLQSTHTSRISSDFYVFFFKKNRCTYHKQDSTFFKFSSSLKNWICSIRHNSIYMSIEMNPNGYAIIDRLILRRNSFLKHIL